MSSAFDDKELRAAYEPALRESTTTHGPDCPTESELFAAVRGEGIEAERLRVLDHALKCPACRRELALLHAVSTGETVAASRNIRERSWKNWVPAALAASLVLVAGLAGLARLRVRTSDEVTRAGAAAGPALVTPANGAAVRSGLVSFTWRSMPAVIQYTLEVDAADGTVLVSSPTRDTTLRAPIAATAVGENRWLVRAKLQDGSEKRSEAWVLKVR
jgi:anti-sigma factor RsiW